MRTLKLTVAYDGSNYVGWQRQTNGLSIQQVLEEDLHGGRERRERGGVVCDERLGRQLVDVAQQREQKVLSK